MIKMPFDDLPDKLKLLVVIDSDEEFIDIIKDSEEISISLTINGIDVTHKIIPYFERGIQVGKELVMENPDDYIETS